MANKNCDPCPAYGKKRGETWTCGKCGEVFRWDGSRWEYVRGGK